MSTPRFDSVLDVHAPPPTDAPASSAADVIDLEEDLYVPVLRHTTYHVRVVLRRGRCIGVVTTLRFMCLRRSTTASLLRKLDLVKV